MKAVYGMHNWPELPVGKIALRAGPLMGAYDIFEIIATGRGAHAAMPHLGRDPMLFAAQRDQRAADDRRAQHASARGRRGQRHAGARRRHVERDPAGGRAARDRAHVRPAVQDLIERRIGEIVAGLAATFDMTATLRYERRYPATINSAAETRHALAAATAVVGAEHVDTDPMPSMGSEDFAFMLQAKPGCYVWLGGGRGAGTPNLHNPHYDFNDDALRDRRELLGDARGAAAAGEGDSPRGGIAACAIVVPANAGTQ